MFTLALFIHKNKEYFLINVWISNYNNWTVAQLHL